MISDCKRGNEGTLDAVKVSPWRFRPVSLVTFSLQVERRHELVACGEGCNEHFFVVRLDKHWPLSNFIKEPCLP